MEASAAIEWHALAMHCSFEGAAGAFFHPNEPSITKRLFAATVGKWAKAVEAGDFQAARFMLDKVAFAAQMMAIHPDFQRAVERRLPGQDLLTAVEGLQGILQAATDMRVMPPTVARREPEAEQNAAGPISSNG